MSNRETNKSPGDRRRWQGGVYRLGEEPPEDLMGTTTAEERLEMLARLTERAWELTGRLFPSYERHEIPARVIPSSAEKGEFQAMHVPPSVPVAAMQFASS